MRSVLYFFVLLSLGLKAQNLVPNPGFELYDKCAKSKNGADNIGCWAGTGNCALTCCQALLPDDTYNRGGALEWYAPSTWYFNDCIIDIGLIGYPDISTTWYEPYNGRAFIIIPSRGNVEISMREERDYAHVKLTSPLQPNCRYIASCYVKLLTHWELNSTNFWTNWKAALGNPIQTASDGMGMYFSTDSIYGSDDSCLYTLSPQVSNPAGRFLTDSLQYMKVSGVFTAQGGEQWLSLGNFKSNLNTQTLASGNVCSIYLIDDVSVEEWKPPLIQLDDTSLCSTHITAVIRATKGLHSYLWSDGSTADSIVVYSTGKYKLTASNGCTVLTDSIQVTFVDPVSEPFDIGNDTTLCDLKLGYPIVAPDGYNTYEWSEGSTSKVLIATNEGKYSVTAVNECNQHTDSIYLSQFIPPTEILNVRDTFICAGNTLLLKTEEDYIDIVWQDQSTASSFLVGEAGIFHMKALNNLGCMVRDTVLIKMYSKPSFELGENQTFCDGLSVTLNVNNKNYPLDSIEWNDGNTDWKRTISLPGIYTARIYNFCFEQTESISLTSVDCTPTIPNLITANNDNFNDHFFIDIKVPRPVKLTVYDSWGNKIYENSDYDNTWPESIESGIYFYLFEDILLQKNYKGWLQVNN